MEFEKFNSGNHLSIGVELEVRILNKKSLDLENEYDYIYSNISSRYKNNITSEFLSSMLEINSPIFYHEKDLVLYLKDIIFELNKISSKKNLLIQTNGSYVQKSDNIKINSSNRYNKLLEEHQVLLENFSICGTHVHIGFKDFGKALKAYNYSLYFLPLLVALSASSVFFNEENSGIHSYRTKVFDRLPKASIPEYFSSYEEMKELFDLLEKSKVISSIKDIWWDVRIQPTFKTLEFRICDAVHDLDRLEVIICLLKVICELSQKEEIIKMPMQVLKQNMWSATRYSMSGNMITKNGLVSIRDMLLDLIEKADENKFISKSSFLKAKEMIMKKSISQEMLEIYEKTKNLKEVERLGVFK